MKHIHTDIWKLRAHFNMKSFSAGVVLIMKFAQPTNKATCSCTDEYCASYRILKASRGLTQCAEAASRTSFSPCDRKWNRSSRVQNRSWCCSCCSCLEGMSMTVAVVENDTLRFEAETFTGNVSTWGADLPFMSSVMPLLSECKNKHIVNSEIDVLRSSPNLFPWQHSSLISSYISCSSQRRCSNWRAERCRAVCVCRSVVVQRYCICVVLYVALRFQLQPSSSVQSSTWSLQRVGTFGLLGRLTIRQNRYIIYAEVMYYVYFLFYIINCVWYGAWIWNLKFEISNNY